MFNESKPVFCNTASAEVSGISQINYSIKPVLDLSFVRTIFQVNKIEGMSDIKILYWNFLEVSLRYLFFYGFPVHECDTDILMAQFLDCIHISNFNSMPKIINT
jgi:hypothetical protein